MRPLAILLAALSAAAPALAAGPPPAPHWAFRRPARPDVPAADWGRNPLDAFILARLRTAGLRPAAPADRATLARRAAFSLTGLPPTPEQARAFAEDRRPGAYERLVDQLLASPHFGERWAQHWLDVARFAESNGYELDGERPQAWRYRDWVIAALNADKPYDRFVTEQVAGDLLAPGRPDRAELLVAAGFNRAGPIHQVSGNIDPLEVRHELLNEMTAGVGAAFLGLTMHCARCHDHKFDPISQRDYYRLEAFFARAQPKEIDLAAAAEQAAYKARKAAWQARRAPLQAQIAAIDAPYRKKLRAAKYAKLEPEYKAALAVEVKKRTEAQKKLAANANTLLNVSWDEVIDALDDVDRARRAELRERLHALAPLEPEAPFRAYTLEEGKGPLETHVLRRGNIHRRGPKVTPSFPVVLRAAEPAPNNRLGLAAWLCREDNPLVARVIVNRLWQHHFGRGLVATPNDFGLKGERPTHPELLDWLATELVQSGWSLKHIHRLIVTSETFRQSSRADDAEGRRVDPDNRLLWRMNRRRLEGEALRDGILAVSGRLYPRVGGSRVLVPLEPEVYDLIFTEGEPDGLWPVTADVREHDRRSVYLFNKRNVRQPLLEAFDQPDTLTSCPVRPVSTFAPQALILLNGPFAQGQARAMAARLWGECGADVGKQVARAYWLVLGRAPRAAEARAAAWLGEQAELLRDRLRARQTVALVEGLPAGADVARAAALADFCLAMLNRNALVYVD